MVLIITTTIERCPHLAEYKSYHRTFMSLLLFYYLVCRYFCLDRATFTVPS